MTPQPMPIIGAGIAGLTLSRTLLHHNIPSTVYEAASASPRRFNYGITLHAAAYRPLCKILGLDEETFRRRVAVDSGRGGTGKMGEGERGGQSGSSSNISSNCSGASFRANRARFEDLLREGVEVCWDTKLSHISAPSSSSSSQETAKTTTLHFKNNKTHTTNGIVIAADGVHSATRSLLFPASSTAAAAAQPIIHPYIVYTGKRKISLETYTAIFAPALDNKNVVETTGTLAGGAKVRLSISVNDMDIHGSSSDGTVSLSWIYSRPVITTAAHDQSQPTNSNNNTTTTTEETLHRPHRSKAAASQTPQALFHEISSITHLPPPWDAVFNTNTIKQQGDRILHWLMRSMVMPSLSELKHEVLAMGGSGVCLVGDAVHAQPILGGNGANAAIVDALMLGERIASSRGGGGGGSERDAVVAWYEDRYSAWVRGTEESVKNLATCASSGRAGASL